MSRSTAGTGTAIVHNTILLDQQATSTVNVQGAFSTISGTRIAHNLLDGGGWQLNVRTLGRAVVGTDVIANRFGPARVSGRSALDDAAVGTVRANVDDLSGSSIDADIDRRSAAPAQ